jgi:hypothetical protein
MTNSMVSLVFRPPTEADDPAVIARLATPVIQVAAGQPREADPAVDREGNTSADHEGNPFDHEDLGVPLTRFETTDTAISTYSSTPLVVKG